MKPLACALLGLVLAACSGGASPSSSGFPADALTTVTSSSGALHIEVRSSPQPPVRGTDDLQLSVTSTSDGKPLDGLTIKATPWMPAMNHGSADATVTALGAGKYLVSDVYMYMPGTWILKTTFSGEVSDHAEPSFEIQ